MIGFSAGDRPRHPAAGVPGGARAARLLVFAVAVLAYLPSLGHELVTDDPLVVANARRIVRDRGVPGLLTSRYFVSLEDEGSSYYRPLTYLALWIGDRAGGGSPVAPHALNVALHGLNAVLLHVLALALGTGAPVALATALLFGLHPAHVESVATAAGVGDLLACAFALGTTIVFTGSLRRPGRPQPRAVAVGLGLGLAAALSKENALVLPPVLAAAALVLHPGGAQRLTAIGQAARRTAAWWLGFLAVGALALGLRAAAGVALADRKSVV
jgi:hypothetical protein